MTQIVYRANLSAKSFPFLAENWGRTVIVPGPDNTFNAQVASKEDPDKDVGIPQIYYCHNVVASSQGVQSVGYNVILQGLIDKVFISQSLLRDDQDRKVYMGVTSLGEVYTNDGAGWIYKMTLAAGYTSVSTAYVSGVTYIWIPTVGCYKYDFTLSSFIPVTLTGLVVADILGICPSYGYLIAWDSSSIAWSSTLDPTDFTPSLTTGAGGGSVEGIRGSITFCLPHTLGFIIYTTKNTVASLYSGNSRYPFNFREIVNSGGVASSEMVSWDSNTGNHYAYTTSGLQLISTSQSQTIFPEVTDFISGFKFEDFDETTDTFSTTTLSATMQKKLTVVADRYLILSYGINSLTHALIYDIATKRWGKLKISHVDCFEFELTNPGVYETPKQTLAFLKIDGSISITNFSVENPAGLGVLILGKYQYVRSRLLQIDQIDLQNVYNNNFSCKIRTELNGMVGQWENLFDQSTAGTLEKVYFTRAIGVNHSILLKGNFNLTSLVLYFNVHGRR